MAQNWIRLDCAFADHPKVRRLRRALDEPLAEAYVVRLMLWCRNYSPDGDLAGFDSDEIEDAIGWGGKPGRLFAALSSCGFVDVDGEGLAELHGFAERQEAERRTKEQAAERQRRFRLRRAQATAQRDAETKADGVTPSRNDGAERRPRRTPSVTKPASPGTDEGFAEFWSAYPRKAAKADAEKAWRQTEATRPPLPDLLAAIAAQSRSAQWTRDGGIGIPYPATWLRGERWGDSLPEPALAADARRNPHPIHPETQAALDRYEVELAANGTATLGFDRSRGLA